MVLSALIGSTFGCFLLTLLVCYCLWIRRRLYVIWKTIPRDLRLLRSLIQVIWKLFWCGLRQETIIASFKRNAAANPNKVAIFFENEKWTFRELDEYSDKVARVFQNRDFRYGDVVALMCYNRPEYIGIWLGLAKMGIVTALINTNVRFNGLAHSINVAKCKAFIYANDFVEDVKNCKHMINGNVELYVLGNSEPTPNTVNLEPLLNSTRAGVISPSRRPRLDDPILYIYTSGTTGLPKAAIMLHTRLNMIAHAFYHLLNLQKSDIIYNPLPLYHTAGGLIGTLPTIVYGIPVVIRAKFSASAYFQDCCRYRCTVGQYIGEICRYLLATKPSVYDTSHSLRLITGNGMRPGVWRQFVERFKIPQIREIYGSTEGNANILNTDNTIGAVGFFPQLIPQSVIPIALIKFNEEKNQPVRNVEGFCIRCKPDEPGMLVGLISERDPVRKFQGYVDSSETSKKIIESVFKKGDKAFLTGDILVMDEFGYIYFKDRTGDTFRWKGENVATGEIELITGPLIDNQDCAAYGVVIGHLEGRAGMIACADPEGKINLEELAAGLDKHLPAYARPLFLRILPKLEMTGTFKIKKTDLQKEGYNPSVVKDPLYFKDSKKGFVPLTIEMYEDLQNGKIKV